MAHDADVFLERWRRWDDQREETGAIAVVNGMIELGDMLGLKHMEVRRRLSAFRREGMSYREAYDALLESAR